MSRKFPSTVGERLLLVRTLLNGHKSIRFWCGFFKISRKTAWKWQRRYEAEGRRGLQDRSRRPQRLPRSLARLWQRRLARWHREEPFWGPKKIRAVLLRRYGEAPALRTIARWFRREGWSRPQRRRALTVRVLPPRSLTVPEKPNEVWTSDFKGWFRTANGQRCEPLTVRDLFSRYVLLARLLPSQHGLAVKAAFAALFRRQGLPQIIRVDNGSPFAGRGAAGLSRLSAWWMRLGIKVEFTRPGCPQDNGAHEQFHRVLKEQTTRPPARTRQGQQHRTTKWLKHYNEVRPHEALGQVPPARFYRVSRRKLVGAGAPQKYAKDFEVRRVRSNGEIKWDARKRFIGEAFIGQWIGLRPLKRGVWAVYFQELLIGHLHQSDRGAMRTAVRKTKSYAAKSR
jgi:putative transposase